jgi:hypothetical protein
MERLEAIDGQREADGPSEVVMVAINFLKIALTPVLLS